MEETQTRYHVRTIKLPGVPAHAHAENYYFPINLAQVKELEESLSTRLEMLNLSKKAEDAAKQVFQEALYDWFYDVQQNSITSYQGCIAPIVTTSLDRSDDDKCYPSNRWGFNSEKEYEDYTKPTEGGSK